MKTFAYGTESLDGLSAPCRALIAELLELKGTAAAAKRMYPDLLAELRERAFLDNVDASARLEGMGLAPERLRALVAGDAPRTDVEAQAAGYASALAAVEGGIARGAGVSREARIAAYASFDAVESGAAVPREDFIAPRDAVVLHEMLFAPRDGGGERRGRRSRYRRRDRIEVVVDGERQSVQVSPVAAFETPLYLGAACDSLSAMHAREGHVTLVAAAEFVVDFFCIRPFDEGTGRIARLLAHKLLVGSGFDVCRYVSVDKLLERDAARYYDALNRSAQGWERNENSYEPFLELWLEALVRAYGELLDATPLLGGGRPGKSERVRAFFESHDGAHSKRDVVRACPDISVSTIEAALGELVREGRIRKVGAGRATAYERA